MGEDARKSILFLYIYIMDLAFVCLNAAFNRDNQSLYVKMDLNDCECHNNLCSLLKREGKYGKTTVNAMWDICYPV